MTWTVTILHSMYSRLFLAFLTLGLLSGTVFGDEASITIELNKAENTEQGCRPVFLFDNQSGHQLNRFQVELALFDQKGVYSNQILLDMAPLYEGKKTIASFLLAEIPCDKIGSILVNDLPSCQNSTGNTLDCLAFLEVTSKSDIPLEK